MRHGGKDRLRCQTTPASVFVVSQQPRDGTVRTCLDSLRGTKLNYTPNFFSFFHKTPELLTTKLVSF